MSPATPPPQASRLHERRCKYPTCLLERLQEIGRIEPQRLLEELSMAAIKRHFIRDIEYLCAFFQTADRSCAIAVPINSVVQLRALHLIAAAISSSIQACGKIDVELN